jgi:hypothetical protein
MIEANDLQILGSGRSNLLSIYHSWPIILEKEDTVEPGTISVLLVDSDHSNIGEEL